MDTNNAPRKIDTYQRRRRVDSEKKLIEYIRASLGEPVISVEVTDNQIEMIIDNTLRNFSDFAFAGEERRGFIIPGDPSVSEYILDERVQAILGCSLGGTLGASAGQSYGGSGIYLGNGWGTLEMGYVPHITMQGEVSSLESGTQHTLVDNASGVAGGISNEKMDADGTGAMADAFTMMANRDSMLALFDDAINYQFNSNTKILKLFEPISVPFLVECSIEFIPDREYSEIYNETWIKAMSVAQTKFQWGQNIGKYSQPLVGGAEINYDRIISEAQQEIEKLEEDLLMKWAPALGIFSA